MYYAIPRHAVQAERFIPRPTVDRVEDETTLDQLRRDAFDAPEFCGHCHLPYNPECSACVGMGRAVA